MTGLKVAAPHWHAEMIGAPVESIEALLERRHSRRLRSIAERAGPMRGVLVYRATSGFDRVGLVKKSPGTVTFCILEAVLGRRRDRLVLLTFLPRPVPRRPFRRLVFRAWFALVERPAVRRSLRVAHVLTERERDEYARMYGLSRERFRFVRWALSRYGGSEPGESGTRAGVVSSGRTHCDWETLFGASQGASWQLTVICSRTDLPRIAALNRDERARVLVEVDRAAHDRELRGAAVYAVCLEPVDPSAGHVRLMAAVDAGVPVVATAVQGLDEYVVPGETALTVPARNPQALREAIEHLLREPELGARLATNAARRASPHSYERLFSELRELLVGDL